MAYLQIKDSQGLDKFVTAVSKALDQALFDDGVNLIGVLAGLSERLGRIEGHMIAVGLNTDLAPLEDMQASIERLITMNRKVGRESYDRAVAIYKLGERLGVNFNEANDS